MRLQIKNQLFAFSHFVKNNITLILCALVSSFICLYGISLAALPFDNQCKNEILYSINDDVDGSAFGYSLNSVSMKQTGNSDYWIYSDNDLQDFQMRNQQFSDARNYVFCAYVPNNNHVAFRYNDINCTPILYESKFQQDNFYFDLPLLAGSLPRYHCKNYVYLADSFAIKILQNNETFSSIINKEIFVSSICANGSANESFIIKGVFDTDNKLGWFLSAAFGENFVFVPEYNIYQMKGSVFFCGSENKEENETLVDFIINKFQTKKSSSKNLATGYEVEYSFFDYNNETNNYTLGNRNEKLNTIISHYRQYEMLFCVVGLLSVAAFLIIYVLQIFKWSKTTNQKRFYCLFVLWAINCISLLLVSLLYRFAPIISVITKVSFFTFSPITSSALIISWIMLIMVSIAILFRPSVRIVRKS